MSDTLHPDELFYVAPGEAPPPRRPPALTVGLLGWLRANLFSSPMNTALTVITLVVVGWFFVGTAAWALHDAEWTVITSNLRLMLVGQYDPAQLWRVNLLAVVLLFLCGISLTLWAKMARSVLLTLVIVILFMVIIPIGAGQLPPPSIRFLVMPERTPAPMVFTGSEGDSISVEVEPINQADATAARPVFVGFIENTAGLSNSRSVWNDVKAKAASGAIDLSQYDLAMTVKLVDAEGTTLAEAAATASEPRAQLAATLTDDGWYGIIVELDEASSAGYAWVRLDGVYTFTTQADVLAARLNQYGPVPAVICPSAAACRQPAERDLRFEGARSLEAYLSVQLSPFIQAVFVPFVMGTVLVLGGSWFGYEVKRRNSDWAKSVSRIVVFSWVVLLPVSWFVLRGIEGAVTLPLVSTATWGGLLLTLVLTVVAIVFAFPLGVLLALGRWSSLSIVSAAATLFIEVVRGVPLITILFFAKLVVPFFISASADIDQVIRMMIGLTLFTAAYIAEIVRGGLQIVPHGQLEAAHALGLSGLHTTRLIVLPQALRAVIPAIMSQFVSLFKDTTLVSIVGLFELLGIIDFIVNGQQQYRGLQREAYIFVGIIYFVISFGMSTVSRWIERTGVGAARR